MRIYFFLICILSAGLGLYGQVPVRITSDKALYSITQDHIQYLEDKKSTLSVNEVAVASFLKSPSEVPGFFISSSSFWVKFIIQNETDDPNLVINLEHATIDDAVLYSKSATSGSFDSIKLTETQPFASRKYNYQTYMFDAQVSKGEQKVFFLRVRAAEQLLVPVTVGHVEKTFEKIATNDLIFGLYIGLILVMVLYNLFLYFSTKEISYFYYVLYMVIVGVQQAQLQGYTFRFLWPNTPTLNNYAAFLIPFFNGIAALEFIRNFLNLKSVSRRFNRGIFLFEGLYVISLILGLMGMFRGAQIAVQLTAFCTAFYVLGICSFLAIKKIHGAKTLLIAWSIFLCSVIVFVLRNVGILPYNYLTFYALQIGSAAEAVLLSLALADRINTYRRNQELARKEALRVSLENERLVKDQNIILERQVHERTQELEDANENLNNTLSQLKSAQSQLVESEKMVSLGQLTAGIAHEINNPINFVTSNIKPLELDVSDLLSVIKKYEEIDTSKDVEEQFKSIEAYKRQIDLDYINEEIKTLLTGIKDGAHRTAEIVSNLKNFARIDEANIKYANLNDGLQSTLMLVKNSFPTDFILNKEFGNIPEIECTPGKINQVFMNIITNGLQSIVERQSYSPGTGILTIQTTSEDGHVKVSIKDNGTGIKDSVREKIFEPFYTTKPVGQGTGLGMSIVKGIIDSHNGTIEVVSNFGDGAEFIITLPIKYLA
jgi:signal transduction histidine kinase